MGRTDPLPLALLPSADLRRRAELHASTKNVPIHNSGRMSHFASLHHHTRSATMAEEMQINPQRAKQLAENLTSIISRINTANKTGKQVHPAILLTPPWEHQHQH